MGTMLLYHMKNVGKIRTLLRTANDPGTMFHVNVNVKRPQYITAYYNEELIKFP